MGWTSKEAQRAYRKRVYQETRDESIARTLAWKHKNLDKVRANQKRWVERHPEQAKASHRNARLKRLFGISSKEYEALLLTQGGACAICKSLPNRKFLHVDHDHETGKVRGLLCMRCNHSLERLDTFPGWGHDAETYLRSFA